MHSQYGRIYSFKFMTKSIYYVNYAIHTHGQFAYCINYKDNQIKHLEFMITKFIWSRIYAYEAPQVALMRWVGIKVAAHPDYFIE